MRCLKLKSYDYSQPAVVSGTEKAPAADLLGQRLMSRSFRGTKAKAVGTMLLCDIAR